MTINSYHKGDLVRVSTASPFTDQNGVAFDPTDVLFSYRNPAGTTVTLSYPEDGAVIRVSAGSYRVDIDANLSGMWYWRWYSTGTGQAADPGQFYVQPSALIRAGALDRRVQIQTSIEVQDGTGAPVSTWSTFATVWAFRRDTTGRERVLAGAETAMADAVFRTRWLSGVTAKMRLVEGSDVWDILHPAEIGRRVWLDLTCTRVRA